MHLPDNTFLQGGKYRIVRFINSGGFGCTYEAEHVMLEQRVAIKEFFVKDFCNRDETTAQISVATQSKKDLVEKLRKKFIDEARSLFKLQHSGIVRVTDVFEENGTAYFVMDYIDGHSLSEIVKAEGALPEERALKYIRQVCSALQYVHDHNRLHLDIKPGNIMIDASDHAILIDFGASKQYDEESGENTSTLMGKTPGYAPLEQMGNDVVKFTPATDIYALGATLYKILTGETPLSANLLASGEDLEPLPSSISDSVAQAVYSAMAVNKKKRPQTIADFVRLLEARQSESHDHTEQRTEEETELPNPERITFTVKNISFNMVLVEGGTFNMGATAEQENPWDQEKPVHQVTLSSYYLGETEVTQALWQNVMGANPAYYKGNNQPVETVSWYDCQTFIERLNTLTGKNFRLPTEAEWEYAARGGNKSRRYQYSGSNVLSEVAWYGDNSNSQTHDIKTKNPNELGIYDMCGNVFEWCEDWKSAYSSVAETNPKGSNPGMYRAVRGGCWGSYNRSCRLSNREGSRPDAQENVIGLRLAL